jgi:hypothetical protein
VNDLVIPSRVDFPEAAIGDLRERLRRTRWPGIVRSRQRVAIPSSPGLFLGVFCLFLGVFCLFLGVS